MRAKLQARTGEQDQTDRLIAGATKLISGTNWLVWQSNGFMDLAEVHRLGGRTSESLDALARAHACLAAKRKCCRRKQATDLAGELRAALCHIQVARSTRRDLRAGDHRAADGQLLLLIAASRGITICATLTACALSHRWMLREHAETISTLRRRAPLHPPSSATFLTRHNGTWRVVDVTLVCPE